MCTHLMKALGNLMPIGQLVVSKETIIVNDEGSALAALRHLHRPFMRSNRDDQDG